MFAKLNVLVIDTHSQEACICVPTKVGYPGLLTATQYFPTLISTMFFPEKKLKFRFICLSSFQTRFISEVLN